MTSTAPVYTVKGIKSFLGREGYGFNATLYRDGKAVAFVRDDASGGPVDFEWKDHAAPRVEVSQVYPNRAEPVTWKATPEEARLHAHTATLPPVQMEEISFQPDSESFVSTLVNDALAETEWRNRLKRTFKKAIVAVVDGNVMTFKVEPTPVNFARFRSRYPSAEVLNDQPGDTGVLKAMTLIRAREAATTLAAPTPEPSAPVPATPSSRPRPRPSKG
jgi:hypothetical protein